MTPEELRRSDESLAMVAESFPPHWSRMYQNLLIQGFTEQEALLLLRTYIHGAVGGKVIQL